MDKIQNFNKGINKDITPAYQPEGSYVDALNIEVISDELQGSLSISNSQGNKLQITIPDVSNIYKISIVDFVGGNSTVTINGSTSAAFTTTSSSTGEDLYDFLLADATVGPLIGVGVNIYYSDFSVTIVPIAATIVAVTVSNSAVLSSVITVPANVTPIHPIGYAVLRDDIYIFSTPCYNEDPQTNGGGYGYIWKFSYNNITFLANNTGTVIPGLANLELIYANDIDLTTWYNIPQTGVVTRYENDLIQRIYWTDNYNQLRSINVVQDQLFALDPTLLNVTPAIDFDIPIMSDIGSAPGTAPVHPGTWQMSYRLKKNNGAVTAFSPLSNMVFIVPTNEGALTGAGAWAYYHGDAQGVSLTKEVTWLINYVDLDFDIIEFVLARRSDKNDPGTFFIFDEVALSNDSSITITCNGDKLQDAAPLTLSEFLTLSGTFSHCKTISTKDNRLVAANIKNKIGELDYDARAYRFNAVNTFPLINISGAAVTNYTAPADYTIIADDSDAICPANLDPYGGGSYDATAIYRADGVTIGGEGPNVAYEFVNIAVSADRAATGMGCIIPGGSYINTEPDYNFYTFGDNLALNVNSIDNTGNDVLQEYTRFFPNEICAGMKFPPFNSIFIGYQHNETYRFGIQFYDKSKKPYFVKWIGDIKFPDVNDTCPAGNSMFVDGTSTGRTTYEKMFNAAPYTNKMFVCQLGINFEIDIPAPISEKISGYSIVRVKREESDKQVISEGLVVPVESDSVDYYKTVYTAPVVYDDHRYFYYSPNILDPSLKIPETGFRFITYGSANAYDSIQLGALGCSGATAGYSTNLLKIDINAPFTYDSDILNVTYCGGSVTFTDAGTVNNFSDRNDNGNNCFYFRLNSALTSDYYIGYVYRFTDEQYSGNTYLDRSGNDYIMASHFRPIRTKSIAITDDFYCYGGDVTNSIMDETALAGQNVINPGTSLCYFFPSSSPVNRELRHGSHAAISAIGDPGVNWNYRDGYEYNTTYSCENDIVKFVPKPAIFNNTEIFDNRFYISEVKINGETQDSWGLFLANNYWDAEGDKGPINSMMALSDKMYFWQDRAFGVIQINPRAVVTDTNAVNNAELQIGTGLPLQRHDYITINAGTKHQGSTVASYGKLYWYDANTFKMWVFNPGGGLQPLSDIKGLYSYLSKYLNTEIQNYDKPTCALDELDTPIGFGLNGISAVYDNRHQRVIYTFHTSKSPATQTSFTFTINELTDTITSFYSFTPRMYMSDGKQVFTFDNNTPELGNIYVHNQGNYNNFYGTIYDSYLKFVVNPNPNLTKTFDNFVWDSQATKYVTATDSYQNYNDVTFTNIRVTNDYQNTDKQVLTNNTNIKRKERSWQLDVPRNRVLYTSSNSPNIYTDISGTEKEFGERIRDKYAQVELWFTNTATNYQLRLNNFITKFRQSDR